MDNQNRRVGLALSGGGYRAAAFHLGTLNKLNELGVLDKVDILSTISGGSITGAAWCLDRESSYDNFHQKFKTTLETKSVVRHILRSWRFLIPVISLGLLLLAAVILSFTHFAYLPLPIIIAVLMVLIKHQFRLVPTGKALEKAYEAIFYQGGKQLNDLCEKPLLAIGSSNLHTGRPFTFSRLKMSDSAYSQGEIGNKKITFLPKDFPISRAVAASSCVPFAFTPIKIAGKFFADLKDTHLAKPALIDGGVYDNQGVQKLTQPKSMYECDVIIVSDAGGKFLADKRYLNTIALLIRTVDLFMYRIKASQMVDNIYRNVSRANRPIAYFSLGWQIQNSIPGFVHNMASGQIPKAVIATHEFRAEWLESPLQYEADITKHLKDKIGYAAIEQRNLNDVDYQVATSVGTNLTALNERQTDSLIRHAENLTELQIKLYCPNLIG